MNYVFINGSDLTTEGQIGCDNRFQWFAWATDRNLVARLPALFDEMLRQFGLGLEDIDRFGVCLGPGSLTGLRVAGAFARALATLTGKPLVGIDLFSWAARTLVRQGTRGQVALFLPTLMNQAFRADMDLDTLRDEVPAIHLVERFSPERPPNAYGIRYPEGTLPPVHPNATVLHEMMQRATGAHDPETVQRLVPLYVIPSQAERVWQQKHASSA